MRLLALRLVRTAFDITLYEDGDDPCAPAAEDATMTAANMINARRLARYGASPADRQALATALRSADQFSHSAAEELERARRQFTQKPGASAGTKHPAHPQRRRQR